MSHCSRKDYPGSSVIGPESGTEPLPLVAVVHYGRADTGPRAFYGEAGEPHNPAVLLLHGIPNLSHMFRDLIPLLEDRNHIVAPDLSGFGNTVSPPRGQFDYTFDNLARLIGGFIEAVGLSCDTLQVFDECTPVGYRLAVAHPGPVAAVVSRRNGSAYLEGLSNGWDAWQNYWESATPRNREVCRESLRPTPIRGGLYLHGSDPQRVSPDGYTLDIEYLTRPGAEEVQVDLILDYPSNVALYPTFQQYFRTHRPPLRAIWARTTRSSSCLARHPRCGGALSGHRPLRAGNPRRGNRRGNARLPRPGRRSLIQGTMGNTGDTGEEKNK